MLSFGILVGVNAAYGQGGASAGDLPPNPKAGECYARLVTPAKFAEKQEQVTIKEASQRVEVIPARYETVDEKITLKEESTRLEIVPAVYDTVQEKVQIKPESSRLEAVPATYKQVTDKVLVSPARTEWKRGVGVGGGNIIKSRTAENGELLCLVEVPAVYKTVTKTVLDKPASTREVKIPAEYRMVSKQVVKTPATTREVKIPAQFSTVKVTKLVKAPEEKKIDIPAQYSTITKREKVTDEKVDWRRVVCAVNLNNANTSALQKALQTAGFYKGPIDGDFGSLTLAAANKYAASQNLPTGSNYIVHEVVEKLNLSF
jgi:hypothetical protein